MRRVAITGGIACGKSRVGEFLVAWGTPVCEADSVAHRAMRPSGPAYAAVVEKFGNGILGASGEIDRAKLGELVFTDPAARAALNAAVHPHVLRDVRRWLGAQRAPAAAAIIPLFYEVGEDRNWDTVVCVAAPAAAQIARLRERGLTEAQARARIAAQMPVIEKMTRADFVVWNGGSLDVLEEQTRRVWRRIRET